MILLIEVMCMVRTVHGGNKRRPNAYNMGAQIRSSRSPIQLDFLWFCLIFEVVRMELHVNQVSPGILILLLGFQQIYGPLIYRFSLSLVERYEIARRHMAHLHTPSL
jgi:hypothetical protein